MNSDTSPPSLSLRASFFVIASRRRGNLSGEAFLEIAELVPSVSEESLSEFASATPRNRKAPRNDIETRRACSKLKVEDTLIL